MERALVGLAKLVEQQQSRSVSEARPRRKLVLSPKRRAALKLHGRYLGYVRQLKPMLRARVKALKAKSGYHAAITLAKRLASH